MMGLRDVLVGAWCPSLGMSAGLLIDRSGRNNHGALTNMDPSTDWVQSGGAGALDFDGVNDFVVSSLAPQAYPLTMAGWFLQTTALQKSAFWIGDDTTATWVAHYIEFMANGGINAVTANAGSFIKATSAAGALSLNVWNHIVAVYANDANRQIYANGILRATNTTSITPAAIRKTYIGTTGTLGAGFANFNGQIDDVAVWQRALTGQEIGQLYTQGRGKWLRKPRRRTYGFVAGGFKAYWARQRAGIIGGGVR